MSLSVHCILDEEDWLEWGSMVCEALTTPRRLWACSVDSGESKERLFMRKFSFCRRGEWGAEMRVTGGGETRGEEGRLGQTLCSSRNQKLEEYIIPLIFPERSKTLEHARVGWGKIM